MKEIERAVISKEIITYEVHPELPGVFLKETRENGKIKEARIFSIGGPHDSSPYFFKPGFLEYIKTQNPWHSKNDEYGITDFEITAEHIIKGEYTVSPENFMWAYSEGHLLFDLEGAPIPIPYSYDYIASPFTNEYCDLKELLGHLKSHPWGLERESLVIKDVPYYNNEEGWKKFIAEEDLEFIRILPPKEIIKEIYKEAIEEDKKYFSTRMNSLLFGKMPWSWPCSKEYKKSGPVAKDYLDIRQFYLPYKS